VVAPPSLHMSGRRYEWEVPADFDAHRIADAPGWIAELAHRGIADPPVARRVVAPRTNEEREEFAELWREFGIVLRPGDNYYRCPLHDDHHPSLHIDAEGCRWYCFGCGRGGGIGRLHRLLGDAPGPPRVERLVGPVAGPTPAAVTLAGEVTVEVVGEAAHQQELLDLTGGSRRFGGVDVRTVARLVPEPDNPADRYALEVVIGGRSIGWLRRDAARRYHALVQQALADDGAATCEAAIRGGWDRGAGDVGRFGVVVFLPALGPELTSS
jgi:hypothetical protein